MNNQGAMTSAQQEAYLNEVRGAVNVKLVEAMVGSMTELCYKKCTGTSGMSLDGKERQCLENCTDRFLDTMSTVTNAIQQKANGGR